MRFLNNHTYFVIPGINYNLIYKIQLKNYWNQKQTKNLRKTFLTPRAKVGFVSALEIL